MVQAVINIGQKQDRVLSIVKGKYGLRNKSDAVNFVIMKFEEELLEPQLRPEFIEKIQKIEKESQFLKYDSFEQFEKELENA